MYTIPRPSGIFDCCAAGRPHMKIIIGKMEPPIRYYKNPKYESVITSCSIIRHCSGSIVQMILPFGVKLGSGAKYDLIQRFLPGQRFLVRPGMCYDIVSIND